MLTNVGTFEQNTLKSSGRTNSSLLPSLLFRETSVQGAGNSETYLSYFQMKNSRKHDFPVPSQPPKLFVLQRLTDLFWK